MEIKLVKTFIFDVKSERSRINKLFKGKTKERLLNILSEFESGHFQKALDLINALPYNKKAEHSEKEYICLELRDFYYDIKSYQILGYDYEKDELNNDAKKL